jgi:cytochrome c oxidase subunit 2
LVIFLAGCAEDKPLNTFEPRGPRAQDIYNLMNPIWVIMAVIFVLVIGGTILLAVRGRVNPDELDPEDLPAQTHGNTPLELAWTAAPAVLLAVISIFVVDMIWELESRNDDCEPGVVGDPCSGLDIMVIGQQWWWEYRYDVDGDGFFRSAAELEEITGRDLGELTEEEIREWPLTISLDPDDVVTATEMVIPAGEQVDLLLTSRDVIHSFWIPRLNGKRDTVPGRWATWSLEADAPGKYTGWCTEYCGLSHARMRMSAIALEPAEFDEWLANQATPADLPVTEEAIAGREVFVQQCQRCHVVNDGSDQMAAAGTLDLEVYTPLEYPVGYNEGVALVAKAAPNLTHFATRTTFAGGIYGVYAGGEGEATVPDDDAFPANQYVNIATLSDNPESREDFRWNAEEIKRWVQNAPEQKAMYPEVNEETGLGRGMPAFTELSDEDLNNLVAYLETLD